MKNYKPLYGRRFILGQEPEDELTDYQKDKTAEAIRRIEEETEKHRPITKFSHD